MLRHLWDHPNIIHVITPAATNSWEPPVPLGGQVYQVRKMLQTCIL